MAQAVHRVHYTRAEYIAFERSSNVRHEYLDGVIYAVAGRSPDHAAIAASDVVRRSPGGGWLTESTGPGRVLTLACLGCTLAVDDVYRGGPG